MGKPKVTSRWWHWLKCVCSCLSVWIPLKLDHMAGSLSPDSRKWKCYCSHNTGQISNMVFRSTAQSLFSFYSHSCRRFLKEKDRGWAQQSVMYKKTTGGVIKQEHALLVKTMLEGMTKSKRGFPEYPAS